MLRLPPYQPTPTRPVYDYTVDVAGVVVRYRLEFRQRRDCWTISAAVAGVDLFTGIRLVPNYPICWRSRLTPPLPVGYLSLIPASWDGSDLATQDGLGWSHHLWWTEEADLLTPAAGAALVIT